MDKKQHYRSTTHAPTLRPRTVKIQKLINRLILSTIVSYLGLEALRIIIAEPLISIVGIWSLNLSGINADGSGTTEESTDLSERTPDQSKELFRNDDIEQV